MGRICGAGFDALVVYEMDDRRGKPAGATAARLVDGARAARTGSTTHRDDRAEPSSAIATVLDVREALRHAIDFAHPGDLVVLGCASHLSDLREALGSAELSSIDAAAFGPAGASAAAAPGAQMQHEPEAVTV
jgi:cyanophycin synthetase